jgi:hypothetical protein
MVVMDYLNEMMQFDKFPVNRSIKAALNQFFKKHPECTTGGIIKKDWDGADYALIYESSDLYDYLSGFCGWSVHTEFYGLMANIKGFSFDRMNSCTMGFYKD